MTLEKLRDFITIVLHRQYAHTIHVYCWIDKNDYINCKINGETLYTTFPAHYLNNNNYLYSSIENIIKEYHKYENK